MRPYKIKLDESKTLTDEEKDELRKTIKEKLELARKVASSTSVDFFKKVHTC